MSRTSTVRSFGAGTPALLHGGERVLTQAEAAALVLPEAVTYWDRGLALVPYVTGAAGVMDCSDLLDACQRLGLEVPLKGRVLDIGCGTGRWQRYCQAYIGLDISRSAVEYAEKQGISAGLIEGYGPSAIEGWLGGAEWITCLSVFTHIDREERQDYLDAFRRVAMQLLVDIIPGQGDGDITLWTAKVSDFEADLVTYGWHVHRHATRHSPDGVAHRYYWCMRP